MYNIETYPEDEIHDGFATDSSYPNGWQILI